MRGIFLLIWLALLAGCSAAPSPEGAPAVDPTPVVQRSESAAPLPTPEPSPTPVQPLAEHALAEPLGLSEPSWSVAITGDYHIGDESIIIVEEDTDETTLTAWTFDGEQLWQERFHKPEPESVTVTSRDYGLGVVSVWFTTPDQPEESLNQLRPVVGDIWWTTFNAERTGVISPARDGGQALSSTMLLGYHFSAGEEAPATESPWFVLLGPDFSEVKVQRSDFTYRVYGSWAGLDWGVTRTETETRLVGGGRRLLQVGDTVSFWGYPDFFLLRTDSGTVQVRDRGFSTLVATHQACAAGRNLAWSSEQIGVGRLLIDPGTREFACQDLPPNTHLDTILPDGWVIVAADPEEADSVDTEQADEAESTPRALQLGRPGGEWRDVPDGGAMMRDEHILLLDEADDGDLVLTAYPREQFNPVP